MFFTSFLNLSLEAQKTYRQFFKIVINDSDNTKKILRFLDKHELVFNKNYTLGEIFSTNRMPSHEIDSPYLNSIDPSFLASMNYFHLAAASLCEPAVLIRLQKQLNIDLNQNSISFEQDVIRKNILGSQGKLQERRNYLSIGITSLFLEHNERNSNRLYQEIVPRVNIFLNYLSENGYDFENSKEHQLLSAYLSGPDYYPKETQKFAQHIQVLIEKQKIQKNLPYTYTNAAYSEEKKSLVPHKKILKI